jgi:hypothetical protein
VEAVTALRNAGNSIQVAILNQYWGREGGGGAT